MIKDNTPDIDIVKCVKIKKHINNFQWKYTYFLKNLKYKHDTFHTLRITNKSIFFYEKS
jgi:hypothetical protein